MSTKVIKEGNVTTEITDMTGGVGGSLSADELMAKMGGQGSEQTCREHNILALYLRNPLEGTHKGSDWSPFSGVLIHGRTRNF